MDKFTLSRTGGSGVNYQADTVESGAEIMHEVAGHFTCKIRAEVPAGETGSLKIYDCAGRQDDGEEIADEALAAGVNHVNAPAFSGTYLRFVFTASTDVAVTIVSH